MECRKKTEGFVKEVFKNKVDKAGESYYAHCEFVASYSYNYALALGLDPGIAETLYLAGLCHDVLEDTSTPEKELLSLIGKEAFSLVKILTNTYSDYEVYFEKVKANRLASIVKLADVTNNADLTRFPEGERTPERREKSLSYAQKVRELASLVAKDY